MAKDKEEKTRPVCGDCRYALKPEEISGFPGYPRLNHDRIEESRFCRRFPRHAGQDCGVVNVKEPGCGEFEQA